MKCLLGLLLAAVVACGPAPDARDASTSGSLVIVVRTGDERVPFKPEIARIKQANEQLARILGHPVAFEVDGALLPQGHDEAADVLATMVENAARDVNGMVKGGPRGAEVFDFVRGDGRLRRVVVRYDPAEAVRRGRFEGRLDLASGTVDVVFGSAQRRLLARGLLSAVYETAALDAVAARYGGVLPDALPREARRAWLERVRDGLARNPTAIGVDPIAVRGAIWLTTADDAELASDARRWLFGAVLTSFQSAYELRGAEVAAAPPDGKFHVAERELVAWLDQKLPSATLEDRSLATAKIWTPMHSSHAGYPYASLAFPGLDRMGFALTTIDLWIASGHPAQSAAVRFVQPAELTRTKLGTELKQPGENPNAFYTWVFDDRRRIDDFARAVLERDDIPFTTAAFVAAKRALPDQENYLRFLARFERTNAQWQIGAAIFDFNESFATLSVFEEAKRLWRDLPGTRAVALAWVADYVKSNPEDSRNWPLPFERSPVTAADYDGFLEWGWRSMTHVPAIWSVLPRGVRVSALLAHLPGVIDAGVDGRAVHGLLYDLVDRACLDGGTAAELAEVDAWAKVQRSRYPGMMLSDVSEKIGYCKPPAAGARAKVKPKPRPKQQ